jgi:hypothetical protein
MTSGGTPTSYIGLIAANGKNSRVKAFNVSNQLITEDTGSFVPGAFHYQPTNKPAQSARPAESGDGKSRNPPKLTIDNLQIRPKKN